MRFFVSLSFPHPFPIPSSFDGHTDIPGINHPPIHPSICCSLCFYVFVYMSLEGMTEPTSGLFHCLVLVPGWLGWLRQRAGEGGRGTVGSR